MRKRPRKVMMMVKAGHDKAYAVTTRVWTPTKDSGPETSYESGENGHRIAFFNQRERAYTA